MNSERITVACALWDDEYIGIPNIRKAECESCKVPIVVSRSTDLILGAAEGMIVDAMCNACTARHVVADLGLGAA
jgi:RNase P subunit RPR2